MKRHYWLVNAKVWNADHYDEFSMTIDCSAKNLNKRAIDDCKKAVSEHINCDSKRVVIASASYLGHMTVEEWNQ